MTEDIPPKAPQEAPAKESGLQKYLTQGSAYPHILWFTPAIYMGLYLFAFAGGMEFNWQQMTFLLYISLFISLWVVYFNTKKIPDTDIARINVRSLRRLLCETSEQWLTDDNEKVAEEKIDNIEETHKKKAETSMQVQTILIAVSILVLDRVSDLNKAADADIFKITVLSLSGFFTVISLVCFVISVDALDVIFNKFKEPRDRHKIIRHFYQSTTNPKYYGMILMLTGIAFLAAFFHPLAGCTAIGATIFVGYFHWFPEIKCNCSDKLCLCSQYSSTKLVRIALWLLLVAPLVIPFINKLLMLHASITLPKYGYALISAFCWALSAPILDAGIKALPKEKPYKSVSSALFVALLTGTLFLGMLLYFVDSSFSKVNTNPYIILAGIFTFPVATGLYYLSSHAFGAQTALASQFARVKPIFSILIGATLLSETIQDHSYLSVALIAVGIFFIAKATKKSEFRWWGLGLGLLTSLSWAVGEAFVKIGFTEGYTLENTFIAISSSLIISFIFILPSFKQLFINQNLKWLKPFAWHGILSFAIAYGCFFTSIAAIGLVNTILITAFWPILAIYLTKILDIFRGGSIAMSKEFLIAALLLVSASMVEIYSW